MEQTLVALRRRVQRWRRGASGRGSRIPEEIWAEAVAVARSAGLWATAQALRFNYSNLKRRTLAAGERPRARKQAVEFVALPMPPLANGLKVLIDLVGRDGEQMRIEVSGGSAAEVVTLTEALWRGRA